MVDLAVNRRSTGLRRENKKRSKKTKKNAAKHPSHPPRTQLLTGQHANLDLFSAPSLFPPGGRSADQLRGHGEN